MSQPRKILHMPRVRMLTRGGRNQTGIRITNVKTIKPSDPETLKKQEEKQLRAELQQEIVSRSRVCANKTYECALPVLSGRVYCVRHILQDPTAPYKQCAHTLSNGERCLQPAPIDHKEHRDHGLCFEHAHISYMARQRASAPPPPVTTTESLLNQLQHYVRPERPRTTSCASSVSVVSDQTDPEQGVPSAVDPFKSIDATAINTQYSACIMECGSASDSDCDSVTLGDGGNCRGGCEDELDEFEDVPCETKPLWRAGVFTVEEAVCAVKDDLLSLQTAYKKQMGRLRNLLMMTRADYLKKLKAEKEQYCSINAQARSGPLSARERRQLKKLKAYASYHRKHGAVAVAGRKLQHKRAKVGSMAGGRAVAPQTRCSFSEGGVRCDAQVLPAAKHCRKHVLYDAHQVLFTACGDPRGPAPCREPVPRLPLPAAACRYHTAAPAYTCFTAKKENSDSESESNTSSCLSRVEDIEQTIDQKTETIEQRTETIVQPDPEPFELPEVNSSVDLDLIDPLE